MANFRAFRHASLVLVAWVGARAYLTIGIDPPGSPPLAKSMSPKKPQAAEIEAAVLGRRVSPGWVIGLKSVGLPFRAGRSMNGLSKLQLGNLLPDALSQPMIRPDIGAAHIQDLGRESASAPSGRIARPPAFGAAKTRSWRGSAYAFARPAGVGELARGGQLGGSQAAVRILGPAVWSRSHWSMRPSLRGIFTPGRIGGAQADIGVALERTIGSGHMEVAIDRRTTVRGDASDAFALTLAAGGEIDLPMSVRAQGYVQGGAVGLSQRQLFAGIGLQADRQIFKGRPSVRVGLGGWAAAQPGVSRIDVGPSARVAIPVGSGNLTIRGEWRFRVAGNAHPGSGPAITVASDF